MMQASETTNVPVRAVVAVFVVIALIVLTAFLPEIYPDQEWIAFLFGHRRFIVFWMVFAVLLLVWVQLQRRDKE
jgi:hypothetical protein